jgi:hypothetical protein
VKIEDGKGKNGDMSVSGAQRGNVSAKNAPRSFYASRDERRAFTAVYDNMTVAAGECAAYLKNTSTSRDLMIDHIFVSGAENIKWKIFKVTGTAAAGAAVEPSNLWLDSNIGAEATAMSGDTAITGLTADRTLGSLRSPANDEACISFYGALSLATNAAIALEYDTGTTGLCEVSIHFHYEDFGWY